MNTAPPSDNAVAAEPAVTAATIPPLHLAALIGSRICHDLVNPLGAIGNGIELLAMAGTAGGPEIGLITDSVTMANARIRLFRLAFGLAGPDQRIGRPEILGILADLTRGSRMTVEWTSASEIGRAEAKIALLAVMACETALAYGGKVSVVQGAEGWQIDGIAPRLRIDEALWATLAHCGPANPQPAQVHFTLLPQEAAQIGRRLRVALAEGQVTLAF